MVKHIGEGGRRGYGDLIGSPEEYAAYLQEHEHQNQNGNGATEEAQPESLPPLPFICMANWDNEPVPEREWSVPDRYPLRQAALFSGEGAAGKSIVQLHLSVAHVLGRDWLGTMPTPGPAIYIDAEDDKDELHRRLGAVLFHYGVKFADAIAGGLHLISLAGQDAVLAAPAKGGRIEPTKLYKQLFQAAGDIKPKMIGIASSANVYGGSEIERSQVQQFVSLLTGLAVVANGSVVLISHPSLTGINTDSGLSGSTQWHNSMRARAYMKSVKPEAGEQPDTDLREISFKKNNYGPVSASIVLRYQHGLFLPVPGISSLDRVAQEAAADDLFLDLLRRFTADNRHVSDRQSPAYAPAVFAKEELAKKAGIASPGLAGAMRRLFAAAKIWNEPCGKPSRPSFRIALKD
jgi:RecA-family ATPase